MGIDTASNEQGLRNGPWAQERPAEEPKPRLRNPGPLIVILLLSLGLWGVIWVVVSALARALLP